MKKVKMIFIVLFAVCIALPLLCFNFKKGAVSEIDNKVLTDLDLSQGLDMENVAFYIEDRMGLRAQMLNIYQVINDRLFHEMEHPNYCYGKDGYVFFQGLTENTAGEDFVREFCSYLSRIQTYCEDRGVPFIYCLTPSKSTVYSQYLPEGYIYRNDFLSYMYKYLELYDINYVDNAAYLTEVAEDEQIFNVKYDAGHWNDLGEFYGMNNILTKVREYFPSVQLLQLSDYEIEQVEETSLPSSYFAISEMVPVFRYVNEDEVTYLTGEYSGLRLTDHYVYSISQTDRSDEGLPSVLFFQGSYFNRNTEMFNFAFGEDYSIHNYENVLDFDYYFNIFQPDCVIFETAEYATTTQYFNYEKMVSKTLNTPLEDRDLSRSYEIEVTDGCASKLSELSFQQSEGSRLVTMTAVTQDEYKSGYYVSGGYTYDLEVNGKQISLTADSEDSDLRSGTLYLFW